MLIALALLLGGALALNLRGAEPRAAVRRESETARSLARSGASQAPLPSRAEFLRLLAAAEPETAARPGRDHHAHPHPITPDHERLYRDVDLLQEADEAIKTGEYARARVLLAQHHRELAGMSAVEEEGLLLLADCAEHGRAEDVERVRSFYEEHTDSSVRRRLRRACLEPAETH
jgi:hypothetical protein